MNLEGLENIQSYTSLDILNNDRLVTLKHLSSTYPPLRLTVERVFVSGNIRIQDITSLQHIENVTGKIT